MIVDTFLFNDELDMLECRLTEIGDLVDRVVIVESPVTFQGDPKPLYLDLARYRRWADKIVTVTSSVPETDDPWQREAWQREALLPALTELGLDDVDVVLHGDVDEIPRRLQLRNIRPTGFVTFGQRFHPFAVDWIHPEMWRGTVAGRWGDVQRLGSMLAMRNLRFAGQVPLHMQDAGWHFSWVGSDGHAQRKLRSFSHTEIIDRTEPGLVEDRYRTEGVDVHGVKLAPVTVDESWPKWVVEGHAPAEWFRP